MKQVDDDKTFDMLPWAYMACPVCRLSFKRAGLAIHMSVHSSSRVRASRPQTDDVYLSFRQELRAKHRAAQGEGV